MADDTGRPISNARVTAQRYGHSGIKFPFNPATAIAFELPEAIDVELAIYNLVGQRVRMLVREFRPAGRYQVEWDAKDDLGRECLLDTENRSASRE